MSVLRSKQDNINHVDSTDLVRCMIYGENCKESNGSYLFECDKCNQPICSNCLVTHITTILTCEKTKEFGIKTLSDINCPYCRNLYKKENILQFRKIQRRLDKLCTLSKINENKMDVVQTREKQTETIVEIKKIKTLLDNNPNELILRCEETEDFIIDMHIYDYDLVKTIHSNATEILIEHEIFTSIYEYIDTWGKNDEQKINEIFEHYLVKICQMQNEIDEATAKLEKLLSRSLFVPNHKLNRIFTRTQIKYLETLGISGKFKFVYSDDSFIMNKTLTQKDLERQANYCSIVFYENRYDTQEIVEMFKEKINFYSSPKNIIVMKERIINDTEN